MKFSTSRYSQDLRRYYRLPAVQVSLTLVLSLFVIAIFIVFALRPTIISIVSLQKTIGDAKKSITQLDTKVANLQKATTQLESIKPYLSELNTDIPNTGAMYLPLSRAIELLSIETGAKLDNASLGSTLLYSRLISPFNINKDQSVVELPLNLRVTGSYSAVSEFLKRVLAMQRVIMFDTITLSRETSSSAKDGAVSLSVIGNAYYLANDAQLQKAIQITKGNK